MERVSAELQEGELRIQYEEFIPVMAKFTEHYLQQLQNDVSHACHAVSNGFLKTWESTRYARLFPLAVTIGNVWFREQNLHGATRESVLEQRDSERRQG